MMGCVGWLLSFLPLEGQFLLQFFGASNCFAMWLRLTTLWWAVKSSSCYSLSTMLWRKVWRWDHYIVRYYLGNRVLLCQIYIHRLKYLKSVWNCLDILMILVSIMQFIVFVVCHVVLIFLRLLSCVFPSIFIEQSPWVTNCRFIASLLVPSLMVGYSCISIVYRTYWTSLHNTQILRLLASGRCNSTTWWLSLFSLRGSRWESIIHSHCV